MKVQSLILPALATIAGVLLVFRIIGPEGMFEAGLARQLLRKLKPRRRIPLLANAMASRMVEWKSNLMARPRPKLSSSSSQSLRTGAFRATIPSIAATLALSTVIIVGVAQEGFIPQAGVSVVTGQSASDARYDSVPAGLMLPWECGVARRLEDNWQDHWDGSPGVKSRSRSAIALDFQASAGTPILAPADGTIRPAPPYDPGMGYQLIEDVGGGWSVRVAHLPEKQKIVGKVERGKPIAAVGSTGYTVPDNAPHFHVELRLNDGLPDIGRISTLFGHPKSAYPSLSQRRGKIVSVASINCPSAAIAAPIQGSSPDLQGSSPDLQGSSPDVQGPQTPQNRVQGSKAPRGGGARSASQAKPADASPPAEQPPPNPPAQETTPEAAPSTEPSPAPTSPPQSAPTLNVWWGERKWGECCSRYVFVNGTHWPAGARYEIQCIRDGHAYVDTNTNYPTRYRDRYVEGNGTFSMTDHNPGVCYSGRAMDVRVWAPDGGPDFTRSLGQPPP